MHHGGKEAEKPAMPGCLKQRHLVFKDLAQYFQQPGQEQSLSEKRLDQQLVGPRTSWLMLTQVWGRLTPSNSIHQTRVEPPVPVITNMRDNRLLRKESIEFFLTQSSPSPAITSGTFFCLLPHDLIFFSRLRLATLVAIIIQIQPRSWRLSRIQTSV